MKYEVRDGNEVIASDLEIKEALELVQEKCTEAGKVLPLKLMIDCVASWELDDSGKLALRPTETYVDIANNFAILRDTTENSPATLGETLLEYRWMKQCFTDKGILTVRDGLLCREIGEGDEKEWVPISKMHELAAEMREEISERSEQLEEFKTEHNLKEDK